MKEFKRNMYRGFLGKNRPGQQKVFKQSPPTESRFRNTDHLKNVKIKNEYDKGYKDGYNSGYDNGYDVGYDEGYKDHEHNERSVKKHHEQNLKWHGKKSKSWYWL